ncbi:hypothetical protein Leryth_024156 [Lithospermum erythrorhizon]|nr:hypothetical protein Leryth_024156 [Lithospermum erythrorhizon]
MASITSQLLFLPSFSPSRTSTKVSQTTLVILHQVRISMRTEAGDGNIDLLGDFGARDPFPAELESSFGDKVLGNVNTEHKILIPNASALSLSEQDCSPLPHLQPPLTEHEAKQLLFKVVGWKVVPVDGVLRLQCLWRLRDFNSAVELINRICKAVEQTGHFPDIHIQQNNQVRAELWTTSIGGLSINDFIVAAKIDKVKSSDLALKKRAWA